MEKEARATKTSTNRELQTGLTPKTTSMDVVLNNTLLSLRQIRAKRIEKFLVPLLLCHLRYTINKIFKLRNRYVLAAGISFFSSTILAEEESDSHL